MQSKPTAEEIAPQDAESHSGLWLGTKFAVAMTVTDLVSRLLGFGDPTWAVISAAFLVAQPPCESLKTAGQRLVATVVGIMLGFIGAYATRWLGFFPSVHFVLVGLVVGMMASRESSFLYGVVVATVVSYAAGGEDPIWVVGRDTFWLVLIGSIAAPVCVTALEHLRAWRMKGGGSASESGL